MINWKDWGRKDPEPEPEEGAVNENEPVEPEPDEAGTPSADADEVPEWVPDVAEVDLVIDGKTFKALSLYELPGELVLSVQTTQNEERIVGVFGLLRMALPDAALERLEVLSFGDLQEVLNSWSMASAQAQAEAYATRGRKIIEDLMRGRDGKA